MNKEIKSSFLLLTLTAFLSVSAQTVGKAVPIFTNGETQIVSEFTDADKWIRTDLWVETSFDTEVMVKKTVCMLM